MEVIRAAALGCCMGVRRALDIVSGELDAAEKTGRPVYTLGPLIHNAGVLAALSARGLAVLDERALPDGGLSGGVVILRAHGVTPAAEEALRARGAAVLDATCPKVKRNQNEARALYEAGYTVFLAGEKTHGEIAAIAARAPGCIIVRNTEEAGEAAQTLRAMAARHGTDWKTALLAQTTMEEAEYGRVAAAVRRVFPALRVCDTVCAATRKRQDALAALCETADAVIVAGSAMSANTRRLCEIARRRRPAWIVEDERGLPPEVFRFGRVGLCAGASTPDTLIDTIERALLQ